MRNAFPQYGDWKKLPRLLAAFGIAGSIAFATEEEAAAQDTRIDSSVAAGLSVMPAIPAAKPFAVAPSSPPANPVICQLLTKEEKNILDRHGTAATAILGADLSFKVQTRDSNVNEINPVIPFTLTSPLLDCDLTSASYIIERLNKNGVQEISDAERNLLPDKALTEEIFMTWVSLPQAPIALQSTGNDGGTITQLPPPDLSTTAFSPTKFYIGSISANGEIATYSTPRADFLTLNGMADLRFFNEPYYPTAKEAYDHIVTIKTIPPEYTKFYIALYKAFAATIGEPELNEKMADCAKNDTPYNCLRDGFKYLADINAVLDDDKIGGTSFSAPYAGNIFAKAMIHAQKQCGDSLNSYDLAFLAAASTEKERIFNGNFLDFKTTIDFQETSGYFPYNIGTAGYGWLRKSRLNHMIDQACEAVIRNPQLKSSKDYNSGSIPITRGQKTLFTFQPNREMNLIRRIIRFEYTGADPRYAHVRIGGDDRKTMRLPVLAGKKENEKTGYGFIIITGAIGAKSNAPTLVMFPQQESFRLRKANFYDYGVKPNALWEEVIENLRDGTINQANSCKDLIKAKSPTIGVAFSYYLNVRKSALVCQ